MNLNESDSTNHDLTGENDPNRDGMAGYVGVLVSDTRLQNQFTQVELRSLKSSFMTTKRESCGCLKLSELPEKMLRLKHVGENLTEQERAEFLRESYQDLDVDFELFLRVVHLRMVSKVIDNT